MRLPWTPSRAVGYGGAIARRQAVLGFSLADPMFGALQNVGPEDLLFNGGPYEDWTVGGVVAEADL